MKTSRIALCVLLSLTPPTLVSAASGSVAYQYDEAGRLKSTVYSNAAGETYTLDAAGNRKATAQGGPGALGPTAPGVPTFSAIKGGTATAAWTAATATAGVAAYDYSLNSGNWINLGNVLTANLSGLSPLTSYTFAIRARDTTGKAGAASSALLTTVADTFPPSAAGVPTFTNITPATVKVSWSAATDDVGVTNYEYQKNGGAWTSLGNVLTANLTGLTPSTSYTIGLRAKDAAGNPGAATSNSFTTLPYYTDSPVMTVGTTDRDAGFNLVYPLGSMSPTTTTNGYTYQILWDHDAPPNGGGGWLAGVFKVSGFSTDPGAAWLSSVKVGSGAVHTGATAGYGYSAGQASWSWTTTPLGISGGTPVCTIVHE